MNQIRLLFQELHGRYYRSPSRSMCEIVRKGRPGERWRRGQRFLIRTAKNAAGSREFVLVKIPGKHQNKYLYEICFAIKSTARTSGKFREPSRTVKSGEIKRNLQTSSRVSARSNLTVL